MISLTPSNGSKLFDNATFDRSFLNDLYKCKNSLILESPFIRVNRVRELMPVLKTLRRRGVTIVINTRPPEEHDDEYAQQALGAIVLMQDIGITVLYTVKHHRKLAIIDRATFWEGSLNILSYYDSCEIMRRTVSQTDAEVLIDFIGLGRYVTKVR